jgi:DNA-binding NarL/FixJ family response regulator
VPIKVLLVDDNVLFRDGIAQILQRDGRFEVIGQASRGDQAVVDAASLHPELILIDVEMPGMSGVEAIRQIRATKNEVPIGVLTMFETQDFVHAALSAGANGYVAKDSAPVDLCEAAVALAQGKRDLVAIPGSPHPNAAAPTPSGALASLTPREVEVLRALATNASNGAIAAQLGISPKTLRNHISNTYRKLGVFDRAQAVIAAVREGLVEVGSPGTR